MDRYICVHGHFYQPPRENAWLEDVELQDSAHPYHDWNERVTAECYAPNTASRILGAQGRIAQIVNNYAHISFNFGPTLLSWLEQKDPATYQAILEADRESQANFNGHGSALAQAYNHMILPLANRRDKLTQIIWGIHDFEQRFKRKPEGMWLPETAVDLETLEVLAQQGIRFTILAPRQAGRVRPMDGKGWKDISGGRIDPSRAYLQQLGSGASISLFFYDGPISRAVAFEGLLKHGEQFAARMLGGFSDQRTWPQLMHIATDGETYGHHSRFGEMALSYALHYMEENHLARLTNYGAFLEEQPPTHQVEIIENTSWSCVHGIERWRADCGCNSGAHTNWNQRWRAPLRGALDWLRDTLIPKYEEEANHLLSDPWASRNDYIAVILDRSQESVARFLSTHARHDLTHAEKTRALKLLELQRHAMLMYTSCGWFFDELSGIETVQIMQYAGRALQLACELFGDHLEAHFLDRLEQAESNLPRYRNGRVIYERFVKPARVDLQRAAAHYAISSLFEDYGDQARTFCYSHTRQDYKVLSQGKVRLALGLTTTTSDITQESAMLTFGVLHLGDHNLSGGVREYQGQDAYEGVVREITESFNRGDIPGTIRNVDRAFGAGTYSLKLLFRDEQRKILEQILETTDTEIETVYYRVVEEYSALMSFLEDVHLPLPQSLKIAVDFIINRDLRRALEDDVDGLERIAMVWEKAEKLQVPLQNSTLEFAFRNTLERIAGKFQAEPENRAALEKLNSLLDVSHQFSFDVNLWSVQNIFYQVLQSHYAGFYRKSEAGDDEARQWVNSFKALGEKLRVSVQP